MKTDLNKHLDAAEKHTADGLPWRALVELGAVFACVQELERSLRARARRLAQPLAPKSAMIRQEANRHRDRLVHLSGFAGGPFEVEEIVLMLTLRVELALASFASHELLGSDLEVDTQSADEGLKAVASSTTTRRAYRQAISLLDKNWRSETPFDLDRLGVSQLWSAGAT